MSDTCELCGEPMSDGEAMFKYHGYSGPCPKPPKAKPTTPAPAALSEERLAENADVARYAAWLRGIAEKHGKGVAGNIDARSLGRIADILTRLVREHETQAETINGLLHHVEGVTAEVVRLRMLLSAAEKDCHKARFALQTIGESTVPDQPASSGLSDLEHVQHHHTQLRRLAIMTLRPEAIGIYEAPRREADEIRVRGVGRDLFEPRSVRVALTERPTDAEIKSIHDWMRGWKL